jgi:hypothetical protein
MALNLIAAIMGWDDEDGTATREYAWLELMASVKYDGYSDFRAGTRFVESLAGWLKQFQPEHRDAAYDFVRHRLVYVSPSELECVIESLVPEIVTPRLRIDLGRDRGVAPYEVWATSEGLRSFERRLRTTLFVGMSDGSRVDVLRRGSLPKLSTEQVVPMMNVDNEKWRDLSEKLTKDVEPGARFERVYLIDDFTASGTTFIRQIDGEWKGKLKKFNDIVRSARSVLGAEFPLAERYSLNIHHYISSMQAREALLCRLAQAEIEWAERSYGSWEVTEGALLPEELKLATPADDGIIELCERYYDHALFKRLEAHCRQADQDSMHLGYADCALPIVLDHNTPNNSIPLLWAETAGEEGAHAMRPLFFRRDRHG